MRTGALTAEMVDRAICRECGQSKPRIFLCGYPVKASAYRQAGPCERTVHRNGDRCASHPARKL